MKNLIKFTINSLKSVINSDKRFIRLTPNTRGVVYFYDKRHKKIFKIFVREIIDSITADQIFTNNDYDLNFLQRHNDLTIFYENTISKKKTPLIIDCGANIGLSSLLFAKDFPLAKIISLEPEKNNYKMMQKNCMELDNIEMLNKAISSINGFVSIDNKKTDNNAFRTNRNKNNQGDIESISINKILSNNKAFVPFLVKIDIEGFEDDLFSKNTSWVKKFPLLIIEHTTGCFLAKQIQIIF